MTGLDLTESHYARPPLPPLPVSAMTEAGLAELADRVVARTWRHGLPNWFWGEGVCLFGMVRVAAALGRDCPDEVRDWLAERVAAGVRVTHVNEVAPGTAAVLAGDRFLSTAEELADWLASRVSRGAHDAWEHWPGAVWADTTFMAGVFLARLGVATDRAELVEQAGAQLLAHAAVLQDPDTGLYAHGSHRGEVIDCRWGRGNAWCALASVDFLEVTARTGLASADLRSQVGVVLERHLLGLAAVQPAHGVWGVLVDDPPETAGILETSAAAGIGAAMLRASALDVPWGRRLLEPGWRAVRGALAYLDADGTLTRVSAGTVLQLLPFGYSVIRDDRIQLWGQGLTLHAVAAAVEALRNGRGPA
jgi:unsaturated rhamnogalacturonyl hydrolase